MESSRTTLFLLHRLGFDEMLIAMQPIESPAELRQWLEDKPISWAKVIAARLGLRTMIPAINRPNPSDVPELPLAVFRAAMMSWATCHLPSHNFEAASRSAAEAVFNSGFSTSSGSQKAADASAHAAEAASAASNISVVGASERAAIMAADAADFSGSFGGFGGSSQAARATFWKQISADCMWLSRGSLSQDAARVLAGRSLWLGKPPMQWNLAWEAGTTELLKKEPSFAVWIDWFERRIRGERAAFDIPGDKGRKQDKWLLRQLIEATNEDFWGRGAEHVNRQLADWLEEAQTRALQAQERKENLQKVIDALQLSQKPPIPVQSDRALRFARSPEGKIALSPETNLSELRKDEDARDRHMLALEDAKQLLGACAGLNSAERLTAILTAYIAAAGETLEEMRPSLFVQKGERLRQELARYEADDTDLPPLPDRVLLDLKSVCKAHNMVVGLDPALMARDTAQLPPDAVVGDVTPAEVQDFVHGADEAGILQSDVPEIMDEAAALVPPGADASDRRFRWCIESCRNLVIEAFAIALNKPVTTGALIAGNYALGPQIFVGNALAFGVFLVSRRQWIEERLGRHAPTWKALFEDLCERLEKHTPLSEKTKNT